MGPATAIRAATTADAAALPEIYRPHVESSPASFETVAPTVEEFAARIAKAQSKWTWLVAERNGQCLGYAYGSAHRDRPAYRYSVEVSVYIDATHQRQGLGRALYERLLDALTAQGYCNAYAGLTVPNEGSVALHAGMGFEPVGTFRAVGWKYGRWHDVAWFHRVLRDAPPDEE